MTTVQTINERDKNDRQNDKASQNKKSCNATHVPTQIAAHFILPDPQSTVYEITLNDKWH
jgi:hypothetical protein